MQKAKERIWKDFEEDSVLTPQYTIKISPEMAKKIELKVGAEVGIMLLDGMKIELLIARKFRGEEAKRRLLNLRNPPDYV